MANRTETVIKRLTDTGKFNLATGIEYCGSEEDYVDILEQCPHTFLGSLAKVEEYFAKGLNLQDESTLTEYRVQAHSIKSTARLLGYDELYEIAMASEFAARDRQVVKAIENHPVMVRSTREAVELINSFFENLDEGASLEVSGDEIVDTLRAISAAAEEYDVDGMDDGVKKLKSMMLPDAVADRKKELFDAVADIDSDTVIEIVDEIIKAL